MGPGRGAGPSAKGSLFLNVGAKPKDPWTALDVAQAARPHLELQNIIHWVKSIAIEKALAGSRAGLADDLAVGHYKPINSERFLNDCHEFVFHFSPTGDTPLDRRAVGVKYQDKSNVTRWQQAGLGAAVPRQHLVHPVRHHPEPRQGAARTRRPSRRGCRSTACACTAARACGWSPTHSSDWAAPRSRAPHWA